MNLSRCVLPVLLITSLAVNLWLGFRPVAEREVSQSQARSRNAQGSPFSHLAGETPALAETENHAGTSSIPVTLPGSDEERKAYVSRLSALISTSRTTSERMLLVTRILAGMTPENALLIKEGFGQSWDANCHFHAEHDLMWSRLGEVLKAEAAGAFIKPDGPFWPVHGKLLEGWAGSDPAGVLQWLKSLPESPHREQILTSTLRGLAFSSPEKSLAFVLSLPKPEQTRALIAAEKGAGNLGGGPGAERLRDSIAALSEAEFREVFTVVAKDNPVQAVSWADAFGRRHPARSSEAYDTIAASWSSDDPMAMSQWLNQIQDHPGSDAMTLRLVRQIAAEDPEAARAWASKIKEDSLHRQASELLQTDSRK